MSREVVVKEVLDRLEAAHTERVYNYTIKHTKVQGLTHFCYYSHGLELINN